MAASNDNVVVKEELKAGMTGGALDANGAEYAMIRRSIEGQSMLTCLDETNMRNFIATCELKEFAAGEYIIRQDSTATGKCFYIVSSGELDVIDEESNEDRLLWQYSRYMPKETTMFSLARGHNFGIGSFFFDRGRFLH